MIMLRKIGATEKRMKKRTGKMQSWANNKDFEELFAEQVEFQQKILKKKSGHTIVLPIDDVDWFQYHMTAMTEELGEVLKADKRWKTHRNERFVPDEKLDELADVFITAMNVCIFSDVDCSELLNAIDRKISENNKRLKLNGVENDE